MKTIKTLASVLAKREGKKSQARIGDIRELLGHLSDLFYEEFMSLEFDGKAHLPTMILRNGRLRSKKKKKLKGARG